MKQVSKIILYVGDSFVFGIKRVPQKPNKDGKLELFGGRVDKGETPLQALIREIREEEQSGVAADKIVQINPDPVEFKVGGDLHFIYQMPLTDHELKQLQINPEENYGYSLVERSIIKDSEQMADESTFTPRTVKIFKKLRKLRHFPYNRE